MPSTPDSIRLITLDPGHFHAALVQKEMLPGMAPRAAVYAPLGFDLTEHINRIVRFNTRAERPAAWDLDIHTSADPLGQLLRETAAGSARNVVMLAGRNRPKMERIQAAVNAGLNVLADKPWVIRSADLPKLAATLDAAEKNGLVAFDMMTERHEATSYIQKELINDPAIFGTIVPGDAENPAVFMESVHCLLKTVDDAPLRRPVWFFDVDEQGEGLSDVGTHLVDLAAWTLFPETILDCKRDIQMLAAHRFPTHMSAADYTKITGAPRSDPLHYFCNTTVQYALRGVNVELKVFWKYENPGGATDTHWAFYRGSRSKIEVRDNVVSIVPASAADKPAILAAARQRLAHYGDVLAQVAGERIVLEIPKRLHVGHEAHFAEVAKQFLGYMQNPASMPAWEKANMLAKYYVCTAGVDLSKQSG